MSKVLPLLVFLLAARVGSAQEEPTNVAPSGVARQTSDWSPALAACEATAAP